MGEKGSLEILHEFVEECAKRFHLEINKYYKMRTDRIASGDWENGYHCKLEAGGLEDAQHIMSKAFEDYQAKLSGRRAG
jgi:hypothetical protein